MIARRLTGILLSLLTLNITVLGADSSCGKHATGGKHVNSAHTSDVVATNATTRVVTSDMVMSDVAMIAVQMSDKGDQHAPCEIPSKSSCCGALVSCSVVFQTNEALVINTPMLMRETIASGVSSTPLSEIVTPDPPPPKA